MCQEVADMVRKTTVLLLALLIVIPLNAYAAMPEWPPEVENRYDYIVCGPGEAIRHRQ